MYVLKNLLESFCYSNTDFCFHLQQYCSLIIAGALFIDHKSTDQWSEHRPTRSRRHTDVSHRTGVVSKKLGWQNHIDRRLFLVQSTLNPIIFFFYTLFRWKYTFYITSVHIIIIIIIYWHAQINGDGRLRHRRTTNVTSEIITSKVGHDDVWQDGSKYSLSVSIYVYDNKQSRHFNSVMAFLINKRDFSFKKQRSKKLKNNAHIKRILL